MTPSNEDAPRPASGWLERASELYASADPRALGAFRAIFAALLLAELARRAQHLALFYSNEGVLSNHFLLYSPQADPQWSLLFSASTPGEAAALFALIGLANLALLVGYHTRAAQLVSLVGLMGLNARNLFLEDRGVTLLLVLGVFTAFLPLGERFSVDALRRAVRAERPVARPSPARRVVSLAVTALIIEAACVYAFDALQKSGPTWRRGEAAHWLLWQGRLVTPLGLWLRAHEPAFFSPLFTYANYLVDAAVALLVLSPVRPARCREIALWAALGLHGSAALFWGFGPFPAAAVTLLVALQRPESLDALGRWLTRRLRPAGAARELTYDASLPGPRRAVALLSALDAFGVLAPRAVRAGAAEGAGVGRLRPVEVVAGAAGVEGTEVVERSEGVEGVEGAEGVERSEGNESPEGAPFALRSDEGWRPDPAGEAALAALPIARHATLLLQPPLRSWLAMPPEPSAPPEPRPPIAPLARGVARAREALAGAFLLAVVWQMGADGPGMPGALRGGPPPPLAGLVRYPRLFQSWAAFAPDVPKEDGAVVVDAVRGDGRHVDPFTGADPAPERLNEGAAPHDLLLSSYFLAIQDPRNQAYHRDLKTHFEETSRRSALPRPERIGQFKIYWAAQDSPPPGQARPSNYRRRLIAEGEANRR